MSLHLASSSPLSRDDAPSLAERITLTATIAASLALVIVVLESCGAGIDFTDEGYYLNWISHPEIYPASHTQFGFIYHPLYVLLGRNLILLRQANVLLTLALAWVMFGVLFRGRGLPLDVSSIGLSFVLATCSLTILYLWLPTPNYRSLALQSLMLAASGLFLSEMRGPRWVALGGLALGAGGWLAFMAKPTSAAALLVVVALYLIATGGVRTLLAPVAAVTSVVLLLVSAWAIDGSIPAFVARLTLGASDVVLLQAGYGFDEALRLSGLMMSPRQAIMLGMGTVLMAIGTHLSVEGGRAGRRMAAIVGVTVLAAGSAAVLALRADPPYGPAALGLQFWALPLGTAAAVLPWGAGRREAWSANLLALPLCFLVFPYVFVFGTNNNYWLAMTSAVVFPALAAVVLLLSPARTARWCHLLPITVAAQVGTAAILYASMENPYRQSEALRFQRTALRVPATGVTLRVTPGAARYIQSLDSIARASGFRDGDAVIDLTGHYPSAVYLLGGVAIGTAWMSGGYAGSSAMLSTALDRVPVDALAKSWLLLEPGGPRPVPVEILERYGIRPETDHVLAGVIASPTEDHPVSVEQVLLRPVDRGGR